METNWGSTLITGLFKAFHIHNVIFLLVFSKSTTAGTLERTQDVVPLGVGSTENLQDIFLGRCYEHQQCLDTDRCIPNE